MTPIEEQFLKSQFLTELFQHMEPIERIRVSKLVKAMTKAGDGAGIGTVLHAVIAVMGQLCVNVGNDIEEMTPAMIADEIALAVKFSLEKQSEANMHAIAQAMADKPEVVQ